MRLFLGVPLTEDLRRKILPLCEELAATGADLKPVAVENLHFTVKFLGEVDERRAAEIEVALKNVLVGIKPFTAPLRGVGFFSRKIRSIWIASKSKEFAELLENVKSALSSFGPPAPAEKVPHVTLARVKSGKNKEKLLEFLEKYKDTDFGVVRVENVVLYESELKPEGPVYGVVKEFELR